MAIPRGAVAALVRAVWDKNTIVISINTSYSGGGKTSSKEVWSIDAQGRLTIDSTDTGPTGPPTITKVIFVKKP
jgi:hypothetical protein